MFFNILAIILLVNWLLYWKIEEYKTDKANPKKKYWTLYSVLNLACVFGLFTLVFSQLCGVSLLPFHTTIVIQVIGILVMLIGMAISVSARIVLSINWANAYEYQIKQKHELITKGIYKYIRHPIYSGMTIAFIGAELVVGSWLWLCFFLIFIPVYIQGKKEEKILTAHFGEKYSTYMKHSKMLIPFIF